MIRDTPKRDRHAFKQRWGDVQRQCASCGYWLIARKRTLKI